MMTTDPADAERATKSFCRPVPHACSRFLATMSEAGKVDCVSICYQLSRSTDTLLLRMLNSYSSQGDAQV